MKHKPSPKTQPKKGTPAMSIQSIKLPVAFLLILVGLFIARTAFARVVANTINPVASLTDSGRHLIVTGPIACSESQRAYLRVTVTQRSTGAVAHGQNFVDCSTMVQQWEVDLQAQGRETFEEGPATAVALGISTIGHGERDDAHQWLVDITLVRQ